MLRTFVRFHCLIACSDDMENQKAMRLAREVDPSGLRTIGMLISEISILAQSHYVYVVGVLTKPDLVTTAQKKESWLDVIEGRAFPLKHGYYCTRQPDEDDRAKGMTPSEARALEADFFLKTLPWTASPHQTRFGTQNMVANLSRQLSQVIAAR